MVKMEMTSAQVQQNTQPIVHRYSDSALTSLATGGGGEVVEVLPYLEIACGSDTTSDKPPSPFKEGGVRLDGDDSLEKQGSLIALAWSKPREQESSVSPGFEGEETSVKTDKEALTAATVQPEAQSAAELRGAVSIASELSKDNMHPI